MTATTKKEDKVEDVEMKEETEKVEAWIGWRRRKQKGFRGRPEGAVEREVDRWWIGGCNSGDRNGAMRGLVLGIFNNCS